MKRYWKILASLLALMCLLAVLSGCQAQTTEVVEIPQPTEPAVVEDTQPTEPAVVEDTQPTEPAVVEDTQPTEPAIVEIPQPTQAVEAASSGSLYIFLGGEDCTVYPYDGDSTPDALVAAIAELTGWNLSLADSITDGKGGMTVSFALDACLFTGPPESQQEEFYVADAYQLTFAVLDSVQKTLQAWASPVNPDSVDIYFCQAGDQPLTLETLGVTWPMDTPYSHAALQTLLEP
jgi:hypothetical protein